MLESQNLCRARLCVPARLLPSTADKNSPQWPIGGYALFRSRSERPDVADRALRSRHHSSVPPSATASARSEVAPCGSSAGMPA